MTWGYCSNEKLFRGQTPNTQPDKVQACAQKVVDAAFKHNCKELVIHGMSNNGAVMYQHFTQLVTAQYKDIIIKGAVFDSAPGPGTHIEHLPFPVASKGRLTKRFLYTAYQTVNKANGMNLRDIMAASVDQFR